MSEYRDDVVKTFEQLLPRFAATTSEPAGVSGDAWRAIVGAGFGLLGIPEQLGGSGGDLEDVLAAVETAARVGVDLPLVEHAVLAAWALAQSGLPIPEGIMTAAVAESVVMSEVESGWALSGALPWVPSLRTADFLVLLLEREGVHRIDVALVDVRRAGVGLAIEEGANVAGESRDVARLTTLTVAAGHLAHAPEGVNAELWKQRGALGRTAQIAGAAEAALILALDHARTRQQFGRPVAAFQAVQSELARLFGEVSAVGVASRAAARLCVQAPQHSSSRFAVAAAKAYASASAYEVAAIAHQVHGALGFTMEHRLGWFTKRLWSWRDEYGNDAYWNGVAGQLAWAAESPWDAIASATALGG